MKRAYSAQRYEVYVKEISLISVLGVGIIFLLAFCILLIMSLSRQTEDSEKPEQEEECHLEAYGILNLSNSFHNSLCYRFIPIVIQTNFE